MPHRREGVMNRQQRRRRRKLEVGTIIKPHTFRLGPLFFWFEDVGDASERVTHWLMNPRDDGWYAADLDVELHGPFKSNTEAEENQQLVLLGPQCKVTEGGMWDPAWDRPQ
jgi:hypothetical protein